MIPPPGSIRAVILDFGGVVALPSDKVLGTFRGRYGVTLGEFRQAVGRAGRRLGLDPMAAIETGRMSEEVFRREVEAELPDHATLEGFAEGYYEHLQPNLRMIAYASALREAGYRTALVTNSAPEWWPLWRAQIPLLDEVFDVALDSGHIGARKPDPVVFDVLTARLALPPSACAFVDDKEENVMGAAARGMHAILFRDTAQAIRGVEGVLAQQHGTAAPAGTSGSPAPTDAGSRLEQRGQ